MSGRRTEGERGKSTFFGPNSKVSCGGEKKKYFNLESFQAARERSRQNKGSVIRIKVKTIAIHHE